MAKVVTKLKKHAIECIREEAAQAQQKMKQDIESEGDAAHDPTILWTNGGPGASSMFGLLVELGPLILNENSVATPEFKKSGVPTLYRNDFGWSKLGGVLMFDWPPPVGFSYCDGKPAGDGNSCGPWDDERMAKATYAALAGSSQPSRSFDTYIAWVSGSARRGLLGGG